jgi:DnaJ-class molecular chaperone
MLTELHNLPESLEELEITGNYLKKLDTKPLTSLKILRISDNELEILENLPESIEEIECENNQLTKLDLAGLHNLRSLHCSNNQLLVVANPPTTLTDFEMENNPFLEISRDIDPEDQVKSEKRVDYLESMNEYFELKRKYEEKKKEYDFMRKNPFMNHMSNDDVDMNDLNDLLSGLFFGQGLGGLGGGIRVMNMNQMGGMPDFFNPPHQGSRIHMFRNGIPVQQKPAPINHTFQINLDQVLNGGQFPIEIERWIIENNMKIHEKQTIYVDIPKGIDDGEMILLKEQGNMVDYDCKGDVKIFVKVLNNTSFERRGLDLFIEKHISLKESLCGFSFELKYINGKVYTINNQTGNIIQPEYQKIIHNMGLTREKTKGNLIIQFKVDYPTSLTTEQIQKINEVL